MPVYRTWAHKNHIAGKLKQAHFFVTTKNTMCCWGATTVSTQLCRDLHVQEIKPTANLESETPKVDEQERGQSWIIF